MRLTLEHLKANPEKKSRFNLVHIWSGEHRLWWGPQSRGYRADIRDAGTYTIDEAWATTNHCGPEKQIAFVSAVEPKAPKKTETLAEVAQAYGDAHRAAQAAHAALAKYWADAFPPQSDGSPHPNVHQFHACCERTAPYGELDRCTACEICDGSETLWKARAAARKARGIALRRLLHLTRKT